MDELDLDLPPRKGKPRREGTHARKPTTRKAPEWTRVKTVDRPKCGLCVLAMVNGGRWSAPDPVVWQHRVGDTEEFLRHRHAAPLRTAQGLPPGPQKKPSIQG